MDWNENQDAGYPIQKATEELVAKFPEHGTHIRMYYGNWENMLGGAINGSVAILNKLIKHTNLKIVALTNWSAETFPIAQKHFDFLNWFHGIVVSGEEGTRKPHQEIYDITLNRFKIKPHNALFIDDNLRNIEAAKQLGINGIHFKNPEQLRLELHTYKINL